MGYQITEKCELRPASKAIEKLKAEVKIYFSVRISATSKELRDKWIWYIRGWCNYYSLADERFWHKSLSGWIRRHIRKCFWLRWHGAKGRRRKLHKLGVPQWLLKKCPMHGSSWPMAKHPAMHKALTNRILKKYGFLVPSDFAMN